MQDADHVLVLDDGKDQRLRHPRAELLATNPIYREVYSSQTQGAGDFDQKGEAITMAEQKAQVPIGPGRGGPRGPQPQGPEPRPDLQAAVLRYVMQCNRHAGLLAVGICIIVSAPGQRAGHPVHADPDRWTHTLPLLGTPRPVISARPGRVPSPARPGFYRHRRCLPPLPTARMMAEREPGAPSSACATTCSPICRRLPIRYFDTATPTATSCRIYTNDVDTLRQMISQSMPQLLIQRHHR